MLRFPAAHVYAVVSDVSRYAAFVPWCLESTVVDRGPSHLEAELVVGFRLLNERYTSRVALEPGRSVVAVARGTQLFHHLRNEWRFAPGPRKGEMELHFAVDFAFRSRLYAHTSALFFDEVVLRMVSAFEARCGELWDAAAQRAHEEQEKERERLARPALLAPQPQQPHLQPQQRQQRQLQPLHGGRAAPPLPPLQRSLW